MNTSTIANKTATLLLCFALLAQSTVMAESATSLAKAKVPDVVLQPNGTLQGRVIVQDGAGAISIPVAIQGNNGAVTKVMTDKNGRFMATGLPGGVYQLTAHGTETVVRAWTPKTAPPNVVNDVSIDAGEGVVRGQLGPFDTCLPCPPSLPRLPQIRKPVLLGAAVLTAIALPLALDDDDAS